VKKTIVCAVIRHALGAAGGGLATSGLATSDQVSELAGAIMVIITVVWSIIEKAQAKKDLPAAG
jgi:hypothetical protein